MPNAIQLNGGNPANQDKFPVMWNDYKLTQYAMEMEKVAHQVDSKGKPTSEAEHARLDLVALEDQGFLDDTSLCHDPEHSLEFPRGRI